MPATRSGTPPSRKVIETRGKVSDADLKAVRDAGYTDANVMEIVALVAMYSLTNFLDNVFDPEKDFPAVAPAGSKLYPVVSTISEGAWKFHVMRAQRQARTHPGKILGNASGLFVCANKVRILPELRVPPLHSP
jgi:hypothetical protein